MRNPSLLKFYIKALLTAPKQTAANNKAGFTMIELVVVMVIIGILAAIAAPGWLGFIKSQRLNTAQNQVFRAMMEAQSNAKRDKVTWQASFRETTVSSKQVVQVSVHRASDTPTNWQNLDASIRLDSETNLPDPDGDGAKQIRFNYQGCPVYNINDECTQTSVATKGRLTLSSQSGGAAKRCVIVSTLLGSLRTSRNQSTASSGNYCY